MKYLLLTAALSVIALASFAPGFAKSVALKAHDLLFSHMARNGLVLGVNTINVYQTLAREAAAIFEENAPFISNMNRAREEDFERKYDKYKPGSTVNITVPPTARVYTGAQFAQGGSAEAFTERQVPVTFSDATDRKHVTLAMSTFEKVFNVPDAKQDWLDRFLKPKMASLAAMVDADMINRAINLTPNIVGTPGTPITAMSVVAQARAKLQRSLTPLTDRYALISDTTNIGLVDASKGLFNPDAKISKQYIEGYIGGAQGAQFFECVNLPTHSNGADVTGATVSGAAQSGNTLVIGGITTSAVVTKGTIFTIAGVFAVHPLTGVAYDALQQFVVTADAIAGASTTTLSIYPAMTAAMPNQTINSVPADTAAIVFVGAASTAYKQDLMYHKDAFTIAMMPLPVIASCIGYTYNAKGFSMRVMTFGDGLNDIESTRIDILCTLAAVRNEWACRMTE
jgi:hypothetical protein